MFDATPTVDTGTFYFCGTDEISNDGNGQTYTRDNEAAPVADEPRDEAPPSPHLWIQRTAGSQEVCEAISITTKRKWRPSGGWLTDEYACRANVTRPDYL